MIPASADEGRARGAGTEGDGVMSNQVASVERMQPLTADAPRADSMVSMLERVLMDPSVPVERLERLLELQDKERQRQAKMVWSDRMSAAQSEMKSVFKNKKNSATSSRYATYDALNEVAQPIYTSHGFSVTYDTEDAPNKPDMIRVLAYVENAGYERVYRLDMPCDGKGAKGNDVMTKTHAVKSALTYAKGTLLPMIFNLAVTDRADDDGNGAAQTQEQRVITEDQVWRIRDALQRQGADESRACKRFKVERLEDIYQVDFDACLRIAQTAGGAK